MGRKSDAVTLHTLPPGSKFRTPDWRKCKEVPEDLPGWEGTVVAHSVGSSTVTRDGHSIAISRNTEVLVIKLATPPE